MPEVALLHCIVSGTERTGAAPLKGAAPEDHWRAKVTVNNISVGIFWPSAGLWDQWVFAYLTAASSRRGLPLDLSTIASVTVPFSDSDSLSPTCPCSFIDCDSIG